MNFNVLNRKVHYWSSAVAAIPLLVIICSGLLLQAKKQSAWVQPPERRGTGKAPDDGSFFGGDVRPELRIVSADGCDAAGSFWLGGVWMFWVPFWAKRKRAIARKLAAASARHNVVGVLLCISCSG